MRRIISAITPVFGRPHSNPILEDRLLLSGWTFSFSVEPGEGFLPYLEVCGKAALAMIALPPARAAKYSNYDQTMI
jgi:hypothetical protein